MKMGTYQFYSTTPQQFRIASYLAMTSRDVTAMIGSFWVTTGEQVTDCNRFVTNCNHLGNTKSLIDNHLSEKIEYGYRICVTVCINFSEAIMSAIIKIKRYTNKLGLKRSTEANIKLMLKTNRNHNPVTMNPDLYETQLSKLLCVT